MDSSVRQAQLLRIAGQYDQAVKILSQLMLVASDDPRVLNEYGKTLTEEGPRVGSRAVPYPRQ